jgi:hypothetical protein
MDPIGLRLQKLELTDQVLSLSRLAESRSPSGRFAPGDVDDLFDEIGLPRPAKTSNQMATLERRKSLMRVKGNFGRAVWKVAPMGKQRVAERVTDLDLAALMAESAVTPMSRLGHMAHPEVPPSLAPPELLMAIHDFCRDYPFETNIFGMTRFPGRLPDAAADPVGPALECAREACRMHGLTFHLADDRKIVDDLWGNVMAHIWGSRYGIAFFEERSGGLNYNLTIEVGSSMALGRRIAVLKDEPVEKLPTDLVGQIYHEVDLDDVGALEREFHRWIRDDLRLGSCPACPQPSAAAELPAASGA